MAKLRLQVQRGQVATVASTSAGATASTETAILHRAKGETVWNKMPSEWHMEVL
jgi:hypothetical protein